ncbi:MAG: hypothetical protein R3E95_11370 [Thiolinea sp.]
MVEPLVVELEQAGQHLHHCACLVASADHDTSGVGDGAVRTLLNRWSSSLQPGHHLVDFTICTKLTAQPRTVPLTLMTGWDEQQAELKANRSAKVLKPCGPHLESPTTPDAQAPVRKAHRYLSNRREQVDYAGAIRRGSTGSGEIGAPTALM